MKAKHYFCLNFETNTWYQKALISSQRCKTFSVKPVYNGHPWNLKKVAVWKRCLIKLRFRLVINEINWPLLTGGRYSKVVIKSGVTVLIICSFNFSNSDTSCKKYIDPKDTNPNNKNKLLKAFLPFLPFLVKYFDKS